MMALTTASTFHRNMSVPSIYDVCNNNRTNSTSQNNNSKSAKPYVNGIENEIVVINVSGKRFQTYLSTLKRFPNSLLGDPEKRIHFYNKQTNEYFFDRCRKSFNGILYFYQSDGDLEKPNGVSDSIFTKEVIFFELSDHIPDLHKAGNSDEENEEFLLPKNKTLAYIWLTFEKPSSSLVAKILAVLSILIIVLSIIVFCLETLPSLNPDTHEGKHMRKIWLVLNTICNAWFTFEYIIRFIASPDKITFIRSTLNIVDLLSILPFYFNLIVGASGSGNKIAVLRVIRVIRVIRIFKLTRHSRGLHILANTVRASSHELAMLMLFLAIGVILFSSAVYFAEAQDKGSQFHSIPHGFWWAVVTMTTVGYGDLYPSTFLGKLIGTLCAISGVLVIALPVPVIVSNFEHYYKEEQTRQAREIELVKKTRYEEALPTIRGSMKMMTEASIVLAGGKRNPKQEVQKKIKDRIRAKISFSLHQPLTAQDFENEDEMDNCKQQNNGKTKGMSFLSPNDDAVIPLTNELQTKSVARNESVSKNYGYGTVTRSSVTIGTDESKI